MRNKNLSNENKSYSSTVSEMAQSLTLTLRPMTLTLSLIRGFAESNINVLFGERLL